MTNWEFPRFKRFIFGTPSHLVTGIDYLSRGCKYRGGKGDEIVTLIKGVKAGGLV
jgi:hypothetical protein